MWLAVDGQRTDAQYRDEVIAVWQKGYQLRREALVVKDKVILGPATDEEER